MDGLGLKRWLVNACQSLKMVAPFPIQEEVIPRILKGENVLGCAPTGQGKTAAYCLPMVDRYAEDPHPFFGLVLCPTRELAVQISQQVTTYGARCGATVVVVTGGMNAVGQKTDLLNNLAAFVVGTPGRLKELVVDDVSINRRFRRSLKIVCLDEYDQLLKVPGLAVDVLRILESVDVAKRLTLCFSATVGDAAVQQTLEAHVMAGRPFYKSKQAQVLLQDAREGEPTEKISANLKHLKLLCSDDIPIYPFLYHLLTSEREDLPCFTRKDRQGIIFANTIEECEIIKLWMGLLGVEAVSLHSLQHVKTRLENYNNFKSKKVRILVATDLAARGLDMPLVDWVVNLKVPKLYEDYRHRVGRCARAGRTGVAITFVKQVFRHADKHLDVYSNRMAAIEERLRETEGQTVAVLSLDEEAALKFTNKINRAIAKAKAHLQKDEQFIDRLTRKRRAARAG